jgi:hypothetical protein
MSDTFCAACGPSTRNGYIRGTDEARREAQGAGATPTTRGEAAGCGTPASGGRKAGGRLTPDSDALGEAAPARRTGGAASSRALLGSTSKLRRELGHLRDRVTTGLQAAGFEIDPADPAQLHSRDANRYTLIQLSCESGEISRSLRPTIQVGLNFAMLREATISLPVASFVAEAFSRPPEIASIDCVSVPETAAEKLVSLTRRTAMQIAGISREPDPTLVHRHPR